MTVMGMVVSPLGWRVNTSSEKQGRMDSLLGAYMAHVMRPQLLFQASPELFWFCFYPFPLLPLTHRELFILPKHILRFVLFCFVFYCLLCLHASPLGLLALTAELITSAQSSHNTPFIHQV